MKTKLLLSLLFLSATSGAFAQWRVKDNNKNNQLKSQEFMQWKFTPNWYYYSWYRERILGVSIKLPGLGIHDKGPGGIGGGDGYVNKDKRNILQEVPLNAAVAINKTDAEEQGEKTDIVYKQELFKFADKEVDYQYTLTNSRRNELISRITSTLTEYSNNGGSPEHIRRLTDEVIRIRSNVKIINDSHIGNAKKREAYLSCEEELTDVLALATRLNNIQKSIGK